MTRENNNMVVAYWKRLTSNQLNGGKAHCKKRQLKFLAICAINCWCKSCAEATIETLVWYRNSLKTRITNEYIYTFINRTFQHKQHYRILKHILPELRYHNGNIQDVTKWSIHYYPHPLPPCYWCGFAASSDPSFAVLVVGIAFNWSSSKLFWKLVGTETRATN